jgi:hypothetical protein
MPAIHALGEEVLHRVSLLVLGNLVLGEVEACVGETPATAPCGDRNRFLLSLCLGINPDRFSVPYCPTYGCSAPLPFLAFRASRIEPPRPPGACGSWSNGSRVVLAGPPVAPVAASPCLGAAWAACGGGAARGVAVVRGCADPPGWPIHWWWVGCCWWPCSPTQLAFQGGWRVRCPSWRCSPRRSNAGLEGWRAWAGMDSIMRRRVEGNGMLGHVGLLMLCAQQEGARATYS